MDTCKKVEEVVYQSGRQVATFRKTHVTGTAVPKRKLDSLVFVSFSRSFHSGLDAVRKISGLRHHDDVCGCKARSPDAQNCPSEQ